MIPAGDPQSYVPQASSSEMHCLQTGGWCPSQMEKPGGISNAQVLMKVRARWGQCIPSVELINSPGVCGEDANYMGEQCLPHPKFNLVQ